MEDKFFYRNNHGIVMFDMMYCKNLIRRMLKKVKNTDGLDIIQDMFNKIVEDRRVEIEG